ncbi:MAG: MOSC domain-containing protein [Rhodospirillales bacterium]|nr:MOSC domain-containing protein [Rhodospirillales bacterium]MDP7098799.1 MOSC domain-containing protein [Rhodospirillales bacterium]HJP53261.1 MOSC domain-containing protein [Rhodospirillales bacterium]
MIFCGPRPHGPPAHADCRTRVQRPAAAAIDSGAGGDDVATMAITVERIFRYPVKGLSAEPLSSVHLSAALGIEHDRGFAIALPSTRFDADKPEWLPKTSFLMLMRNERLAKLETRFDAAEGRLTVFRGGKQVATGRIATPVGRAVIEDFFAAYMKKESHGKPRLIEAPPKHMFTDHREPVISLINLASVKDLERVAGGDVDPLRFRANLYLQGGEPWAEFGWLGKEIAIGRMRAKVTERIDRCAAVNVNPATGERDMNLLKDLQKGFGHVDMGIYAEITATGAISAGDVLKVKG